MLILVPTITLKCAMVARLKGLNLNVEEWSSDLDLSFKRSHVIVCHFQDSFSDGFIQWVRNYLERVSTIFIDEVCIYIIYTLYEKCHILDDWVSFIPKLSNVSTFREHGVRLVVMTGTLSLDGEGVLSRKFKTKFRVMRSACLKKNVCYTVELFESVQIVLSKALAEIQKYLNVHTRVMFILQLGYKRWSTIGVLYGCW